MYNDTKNFIYKKVSFARDGLGTNYAWYLINKERREGVHFHGCKYAVGTEVYDILARDCNKHNFSTYGIESHKKTKQHENQTPQENCDVTGGDCYCDGSSLQAREKLGFINPDSLDDDRYIWNVLHDYYASWIGGEDV
jgi:hypothetical protein